MVIRLRAGCSVRRFEPHGDRLLVDHRNGLDQPIYILNFWSNVLFCVSVAVSHTRNVLTVGSAWASIEVVRMASAIVDARMVHDCTLWGLVRISDWISSQTDAARAPSRSGLLWGMGAQQPDTRRIPQTRQCGSDIRHVIRHAGFNVERSSQSC
jgi:hypothetical protein